MLRASLNAAPAVLAVGLLSQGCDAGTPCLAYAVSSLSVTVVDATTREGLCGASVTASDGTFSESLLGFGTPCVFSGPYERPGSYSVRAEREGYLPARVDNVLVRLSRGPCPHVETAFVTLALERR